MNTQQSTQLVRQGYLSLQQNNPAQAVNYFNQAKTIDPLCFDAWFALGNLFSQTDKINQSVVFLQKAIAISPDNPAAHGQLGVVLYRLQRVDEAISCYKKVIELQADNPAAYANLAMVYINIGKREEAVRSCLHALKLKPDFTGAYILLASAYMALGLFEQSLSSYNDALQLEADNIAAIAGKADILIKLGNMQQAYATIKTSLKNKILEPSIAITYAALSTSIGEGDRALPYLESALKIKALTAMQKLQLHFAAGRLYDRLSQYDKAFQHYVNGNALVQRQYDAESDKVLFDAIIENFSKDSINRLSLAQQSDIAPVFIVGMPRSGTSLVERILGAHAAIFPAGELPDIPKLAEAVTAGESWNKKNVPDVFKLSEDELTELSDHYMAHIKTLAGDCKLVTDKLPHNFLFLGLIALLFPNAKIIHCKRDSLDTCLSNYFQYFSGPLSYPYKLKNIATHYNNYQRIMAHWKKNIELPLLEVSYEDMVHDQEKETRQLLSFLELPWDKNCLDFNKTKQLTRTASYQQVRESVYTRSVGRWQHYQKHINELVVNLLDKQH